MSLSFRKRLVHDEHHANFVFFYIPQFSNINHFIQQMQSSQQLGPERTSSTERDLTASPFFVSRHTTAPSNIVPTVQRFTEPLPESQNAPTYVATSQAESTQAESQSQQLDSLERITSVMFDNLRNNVLPPRRVLPFATEKRSYSADLPSAIPKSAPLARSESTMQPTKSANVVLATPAPKPTKRRVAQRKGPLAKLVEEEVPDVAQGVANNELSVVNLKPATTATSSQEDQPSPLAAKSAAALARPGSAPSGLPTKATAAAPRKRAPPARQASAAKRGKMVDTSTQTQTISGRDHTSALQLVEPNVASKTVEKPPPVPAPVSPPPESYQQMVDNFVSKNKHRPAPIELWQTPGYSTMDEDQRQSLLNDFICDNLENEDFITLCEDMDKSWRRTLGL